MSIEVLYEGTGADGSLTPTVDIVAVHGLNPWNTTDHATKTWQSKGGHLWLRDTLPKEVPDARMMLYSYGSSPAFGTEKDRFIYQANSLLECLRLRRRKDPTRPLIMVGHSLGGILIKQALVNAHANPLYKPIIDATYGLVFFGTPHAGPTEDAKVRFAKACVSIVQSMPGNPSNDIMEALKSGSLYSDILKETWRHQLEKYQIVSFYEGIGNLVPRDSAIFGLPGDRENAIKLDAKHEDMCRFDLSNEKDKNNYFLVEGNLGDMCEAASKQSTRNDVLEYLDAWKSRQLNVQNPRFRNILEPHEKNFEWIWIEDSTGPGFVDWLRNGKDIFWISGKPGSGKSTLMKHLFEDPRTSSHLSHDTSKKVVMLRYFFHELGQTPEKQFRGFLSAVLLQLIDNFPDVAALAIPVFKQECDTEKPTANWICSERGLREIFRGINSKYIPRRTMCLFLDGLDECEGDQREHVRFLISWLEFDGALDLKICLASRPLLEIEIKLSAFPGMKIQDWTKDDIAIYARDRLNEFEPIHDSFQTEMHSHLIDKIIRNASGVFLWVKIVVDELIIGLEEGDYPSELQRRLESLPPDLEDLYSRILGQIPAHNLHDTVHYFSLLIVNQSEVFLENFGLLLFTLASCDPLEALEVPVQTDADNEELISLCKQMILRLKSRCRTLVQITEWQDQSEVDRLFGFSVEFTHRTVKEYVSKPEVICSLRSKAYQQLHYDPEVCVLAGILRLLKTPIPRPTGPVKMVAPDSDNLPEGFYFVEIFMYQAWSAEQSTGSAQTGYIDELEKVVLKKVHRHWAKYFYKNQTSIEVGEDELDMLSIAALEDLELYMKDKISTGDVKLRRKSAKPLLLSIFDRRVAENGSAAMTSLLLQNGAEPNEIWKGVSIWERAIERASNRGFFSGEAIFKLMLQHGANANQRVTRKEGGFSTALNACILRLMKNEKFDLEAEWTLIRTFLEYGANPDLKDSDGFSARDIAMCENCDPIVMKMISEFDILASSSSSKRAAFKGRLKRTKEKVATLVRR